MIQRYDSGTRRDVDGDLFQIPLKVSEYGDYVKVSDLRSNLLQMAGHSLGDCLVIQKIIKDLGL